MSQTGLHRTFAAGNMQFNTPLLQEGFWSAAEQGEFYKDGVIGSAVWSA